MRLSDAERNRRSREKQAREDWERRQHLATDWEAYVAARRGFGKPKRPAVTAGPTGPYREFDPTGFRAALRQAVSEAKREALALTSLRWREELEQLVEEAEKRFRTLPEDLQAPFAHLLRSEEFSDEQREIVKTYLHLGSCLGKAEEFIHADLPKPPKPPPTRSTCGGSTASASPGTGRRRRRRSGADRKVARRPSLRRWEVCSEPNNSGLHGRPPPSHELPNPPSPALPAAQRKARRRVSREHTL